MTALELLAPARNADIGIAAVDCGADAVYIAGPAFGARKDAGNPISEVRRLCDYAHRFGVKVFLTVNIKLRDEELEDVHAQMLQAQEAGVDAFIIRDERICLWEDIVRPLHASTQCAIRTPESAKHFQDIGCERIVLERELSLDQVREICSAVTCEVEFFVHGALCVCYSGECTLSEYIDGRSADRGECIQACRSLYDLVDDKGKTLVKNKALLSLKDYNLKSRIRDLAEAGVMSFKIEGRLKNASYVKNVTRDYSDALDAICRHSPGKYCRASWGHPEEGFIPDTSKTFNRGYTSLFLDGKKGKWSSMDAPKSMGEAVGTVASVKETDRYNSRISVKALKPGLKFQNGDGFAFTTADGITGFRADRAEGLDIFCRTQSGLKAGTLLYRNISAAFEKSLESDMCRRYVHVGLEVKLSLDSISVKAVSEDGREVSGNWNLNYEKAANDQRTLSMLRSGLDKKTDIYSFNLKSLETTGDLPVLPSSFINSIRRTLAEELDNRSLVPAVRTPAAEGNLNSSYETAGWFMRTRYCIKYELGLCRKYFKDAPQTGELFLVNNGRRLGLEFDCAACEMYVIPVKK